jgi:hypothetical protein
MLSSARSTEWSPRRCTQAVRAGLRNQDGRARSSLGSVYRNLSATAIAPLLPAIHQAVVEPAPSGEMFADGIRVEGLRVLAKNRIAEGIAACVQYARDQNPWESQIRTPELMAILCSYGAKAKVVLPELRRLGRLLREGRAGLPGRADAAEGEVRARGDRDHRGRHDRSRARPPAEAVRFRAELGRPHRGLRVASGGERHVRQGLQAGLRGELEELHRVLASRFEAAEPALLPRRALHEDDLGHGQPRQHARDPHGAKSGRRRGSARGLRAHQSRRGGDRRRGGAALSLRHARAARARRESCGRVSAHARHRNRSRQAAQSLAVCQRQLSKTLRPRRTSQHGGRACLPTRTRCRSE